jgi:catechol 2,3-dioxygenase-like lactoylglutathione lyase family enzyme
MTTPTIGGIHHLKLPVSDLAVSLAFYERVFGARRIPEADHRRQDDGSLYAYILIVPGLGTLLELRLHPVRARAHAGFDPIILSVADRAALQVWSDHLDALAIPHSPVITAIQAWLMVIEDPDGHRLRLYTDEKHGPEHAPDEDSPWIRD